MKYLDPSAIRAKGRRGVIMTGIKQSYELSIRQSIDLKNEEVTTELSTDRRRASHLSTPRIISSAGAVEHHRVINNRAASTDHQSASIIDGSATEVTEHHRSYGSTAGATEHHQRSKNSNS